jgi:hypothetical protein
MGKITRTFSIDDKKFERFENICKDLKLKKSEVLQNCIDDFILNNINFDDKLKYKLKENIDENPELLSITESKDNFITLSNGNTLNVLDFEKIYESVDKRVLDTVEYLNSSSSILTEIDIKNLDDEIVENIIDVDSCSPERFFAKSFDAVLPLYKEISKIDTEDAKELLLNEIKEMNEINKASKENIIEFKLKNISDNVYDLTKIFGVDDITIIRNHTNLFIYCDDIDQTKYKMKDLIKYTKVIGIKNITFFSDKYEQIRESVDIEKLKDSINQINININKDDFELKLSLFLSTHFQTSASVKKYVSENSSKEYYYIKLDPKFYIFSELFDIFNIISLENYIFDLSDLILDNNIKKYDIEYFDVEFSKEDL